MNIPEELKGKDITLEHLRLNEIAWRKNEALRLIYYLQSKGSFVLGGDVLKKDTDGYSHNYDN